MSHEMTHPQYVESGREDQGVGTRAILVFVVVSLALLMSSIGATVVAVGLPAMMDGLNTSLVWIGWVITGYTLTQAIVMPVAGKLTDEFGQKPLFLGCVVLFTVGSLLCTIAPNVYLMIVFRVLQALGGGAFMPSATSIIADVFGPRYRATAIGLFTSVFPIGGIIGPNVGGWVIDSFGWRAMFAINVPIGILILALGIFLLPRSRRGTSSRRVDSVGIVTFALGLTAVMYGMTVWGNNISFNAQVAIWVAGGLAALVYFIYHESRTRDPMIEIRLLRERAFFAANLYNFMHGAMVFGFFSFIPLYATVEYAMSAGRAGLVLTPRAILMILFSTLGSFTLSRTGYRAPMIAGLVLNSIGLLLMSQSWHQPEILGYTMSDTVLLSILVGITGIGVGIGSPAANNAALDLMPEAVGRISGLRGMFRSVGGVLSTSIIVLILAHYQNRAEGLSDIFLVLGFLILLAIPVVFMIPDTARLRRRNGMNPVERPAPQPADD